MKKLIVNENCIGCGACIAIDSEHFDFNDEGFSTVISNENLDTDEVKNAISSCPVNAIKIEDGENTCGCGDTCGCGEDCQCDDSCPCKQNNEN